MPSMNQLMHMLIIRMTIRNMLKTMSTMASRNNHTTKHTMLANIKDIQLTTQSTQLLLSIQWILI